MAGLGKYSTGGYGRIGVYRVNLQAIEDRKSNLEILSKLEFPMTPCVTSLPREFPSKVNGIPELEFKYI